MSRLQDSVKEHVENALKNIRAKNPRFSLRALAKKWEISPATLSRLINNDVKLSRPILRAIVEKLELDDQKKRDLLGQELDPYITAHLEGDYIEFIENWYYSAIISLAELKGFKSDAKWIAARLNLKHRQVAQALRCLYRLGLLVREENGRTRVKDVSLSTLGKRVKMTCADPNIVGKANRLKECLTSSWSPSFQSRSDISSVILSIDRKKLPEAKERIRLFRRSLANFLDTGNKSDVYLLFLQLLPLSN